jgi:hypothetical protein
VPDVTGQTGERVTIVAHRPGCPEIPWVRFLLGEWAGEVVEDPERRLVLPYSLMVSDRPEVLKGKVLAAVRRMGTIGLLHISDKRYRAGLEAYRSFGFVWRNYYHSGLSDWAVRQLPLGPAIVPEITAQPSATALRRPAERLYTWSFAGQLSGTRGEMIEAFRQIEGGHEYVTGGPGWSDTRDLDAAAILDLLGDSVFAPCGTDDGQLESSRIYEALEVGAIPVVERRRRLDYFHELLGDHPLPTVRSWAEAPSLVRRLLADQAALARLHDRVVTWWTETKEALADVVQDDAQQCFTDMLRGVERSSVALDRPAPRWRGRVEMLRHSGRW